MTKTKKILPHEWIEDHFCPVIGILTTQDVDALCHKNNLSMVEMLQPFSKLTSDVPIKDPEGANHSISSLSLAFQDFQKDPTKTVGPRLLADTVASVTEEPLVSRAFPSRSLQLEAPGFTPWFDSWTKIYLQSLPSVEHEFLRHHIGCVFVVSSNAKDPLEQLRNLIQTQHKVQHERSSSGMSYPQYFTTNALKYYVLLHDVYSTEESKAHEVFKQMQASFGSTSCHLLQFNSRTVQNEGDDSNPNVAEHWTNMSFGHRFSLIETRLMAVSGDSVLIPNANNAPPAADDDPRADSASKQPNSNDELEHPLADASNEEKMPHTVIVPKLVPVTKENIALHLTYNDIDRIRIMIREFVTKCLVPYCERQLRLLFEIVTNRKSRSLFSGAKRWFGQSKPGVAMGTSVIYGKDAPELQLRKLADLYFMLKMYKNAYTHYHNAKKDFQSDEAWNYYAGAAEMCALAQFMQGDAVGKKYPAHYMEDSITKYLQVCQMPEFAIRASLFDAMCLKYQGMFQESALSYVRMTNEAKDLRSALLLEQAAYCYLMCTPPLVRKYAFHIILSGYRFSKSGQKKHSSRAYRQGFQVYKSHGWELAENHILYTLGHQSLLLKDHYTAASLFNELVATTNVGLNPLQQMCHLREFFIVHHMREKEDKAVATITIPFFKANQCLIDLTGEHKPHEALVYQAKGSAWNNLEKTVTETIHGQEFVHLNQTCQPIFGPNSSNSLMPEVAVNEEIRLLLPVTNPFQTPLLMRKLKLIWKFTPQGQETAVFSNTDADEAVSCIKAEVIDNVKLEKETPLVLDFKLTPLRPGELSIHGIEYTLKALFPQSESTDYTIKGKQALKVQGPRLNATKEHKVSKTPLYMKDNRLSCRVVSKQPRLRVSNLKLPEVMFQGQVQSLDMVIENVGNAPMTHLHLVHHSPGMFSLGADGRRPTLFDFPLIKDNEELLDILPITLGPDNILHPGAIHKQKLWICAPSQPGSRELSVFFAYNIPFSMEKKPLKRLLKMDLTTKVLPSVGITASLVNACRYDDDKSQGLLVNVTNFSNEAKSQQIEQAYVWQVSMISTSRVLSGIVSSNENVPVSRGESLVLGLLTAQAAAPDSHGCNFSSLRLNKNENNAEHVDVAPLIDFLKNGFAYGNLKEPAKLMSDMIVLSWRAPNERSGIAYCVISPDETLFGDQVDHTSSVESIEVPALPSPKKACRVRVVNSCNIRHDFDQNPVCLVQFNLVVENFLPTKSVFRYKTDGSKDFSKDMGRFLGCTKAAIPLDGQSKKSLKFHVAVSAPGLYSYNGLSFQMTEVNGECDDDEFIPLEVNFLVD